jgi:pyrroloquinoline quinone biosynthesis protein B
MYLGREALNAKEFPVYAMPRMYEYLKNNGPWSQLVSLNNIKKNIKDVKGKGFNVVIEGLRISL